MTSLFYDLVPKDVIENLRWRIRCRERAISDFKFRDAFHQACMSDVCFFMAACCYGYDPRARNKVVPFIPYPHQEYVFCKLDEAIDYTQDGATLDVLVDKARAQGGTFGYLWVDLRRWLRDSMFSAGYVTRNADLVDSKTDSDTVFWKVQFGINMLPVWMRPKYERNLSQHTFENKENGSLLKGYSAGQDVAAGGRASVFTMDEAGAKDFVAGGKDYSVMESLHDVTNCIFGDTLVVTDQGVIPIASVELHHRVWDGTMWVSHHGCVYQGEQEVIQSYGILCTPDHEVMTTKGWKNACIEGFDREEISLPDGYREKWLNKRLQSSLEVSVRLRKNGRSVRECSAAESQEVLRVPCVGNSQGKCNKSWNEVYSDLQQLVDDEASLLKPSRRTLCGLRWSRNYSVRSMDVIRELPCRHGGKARRINSRQISRSKRKLRAEQLPVGNRCAAISESSQLSSSRNVSRGHDSKGDCGIVGTLVQHDHKPHQERLVRGSLNASIPNLTSVYDLLNCGPRAAFTVIDDSGRPLLVHNCLRLVSARYLDQGVFHEACEAGGTEGGWHLVLDWKDHPVHSKHSYVVIDNVPKAVKPEDQEAVDEYHKSKPNLRDLLEKKGFKYEGVVRSPWYDMRCLRKTARPQLIASQLDRNPKGAVGKVFSHDLLERMKKVHSKPYVWKGNPVFDSETLELTGLIPREDGTLTLWFRPGIDNSPPLGPFTIACDIASGGVSEFASNSVASGIDDRTGEQVLEYVIKGLEPRPFARRVVGLCLWMRKALLGWEDSGVSGGFAKEIMEVLYYGNIHFRETLQIGTMKKSRKPGFPSRDEDKADMLEQFAIAMDTGGYTPRSPEMLVECGEYEWGGGKIVHAPSKNKGANNKNHGDRAIAAAGAWLVYSKDKIIAKVDSSEETCQNPEYGSFLWRERQERHKVDSGGPGYGIRNVLRG